MASTNQWSEEYGVDGGPDYLNCLACGKKHLTFPGADYCRPCTTIRQEHCKRVKDRGECRGGCGCTIMWHSLRCSACRTAGRWAAETKNMRVESKAINWDKIDRSRGNAKIDKENEVQRYLESRRGHDGNS